MRSRNHFKVHNLSKCVHVCVQLCVFSPLLDGNAMHDDGVGDFDLLFYSGGVSNSRPFYGSLVCNVAHSSDDTI